MGEPDLVLSDIGMPRLNGYEAAQKMRQQCRGRRMVLIAMTGWGQEDDKRHASQAGYDVHLVKPVDLAALEWLLISLDLPDREAVRQAHAHQVPRQAPPRPRLPSRPAFKPHLETQAPSLNHRGFAFPTNGQPERRF